MRSRVLILAVLAVLPPLLAEPLGAQGSPGLRAEIQQRLFTFGACGEALCLDLDNIHGNHFMPALAEGNQGVILFLSDAMGRAAGTVPLAATSSGATFTFVGGLPVPTSTSAGPIFGERAQTLGRGRFFLGASLTGIRFTSLNGVPLSGLHLNFRHEDNEPEGVFGDPNFENDVIALQLRMEVNLVVAMLALTYGLTDFIDLGVALPLVRTSVKGRSEAQILPFGDFPIHRFGGTADDPVLRATAAMDGSASGIGDVVTRAKVNLGQGERYGASLLVEARLPTGDEEDLLGSGASDVRALGILSARYGTFSPHLNLGYSLRQLETRNDALLITVGFDNLMTEWATLGLGVISETAIGDPQFELPGPIVWDHPFRREMPTTNIPPRSDHLLHATMGTKFTVREGTVLTLNGLLPLRKVGLQPDFYWTVGLDLRF
jgi:hypothetical protein